MSSFSLSKPLPIIICIEGNIGCGKSTLIDELEKKFGSKYIYLREPVSEWEAIRDGSDKNILQRYYEEPKKYAYSIQTLIYLTFYKQLKEAIEKSTENTVIICERSMYSSQGVFAKMLYKDGIINEIEYQVLTMFYSQFEPIPIDAVIYLDTDIFTCKKRITKRSRIGEENVKIGYLDTCEKQYKEWLYENSNKVVIESIIIKETDYHSTFKFIEEMIDKLKNSRNIIKNYNIPNSKRDKYHCCNCNVNLMFTDNKKSFYTINGIELSICTNCISLE